VVERFLEAYTGAVDLNSFRPSPIFATSIIKPRPVITGNRGGGILPPVGGQIQFQVNSISRKRSRSRPKEPLLRWREPACDDFLAERAPSLTLTPERKRKRFIRKNDKPVNPPATSLDAVTRRGPLLRLLH